MKAAQAAGLAVDAYGHDRLDLTQPATLFEAFQASPPAVVVNAAAFHQVDRCEDDPESAFQVNAVGALHAARAAKAAGARFVHVSTDYVFDGKKGAGEAYDETDTPGPLNVYGTSKLAGEHAVLHSHPTALVVRVASLFGAAGSRGKGGNFIENILRKGKEEGRLRIVNDQWMTPTYTRHAAAAIVQLGQRAASGVVHATNTGAATWHAFASKAVELAGLKIPVEPISAASFPSKAARPANSALSTKKLARLLGAPLPAWPAALEEYLREKGHVR